MMLHDPALNDSKRRDDALARWSDLAADAAEPNIFYAPELLVPALDHLAGDTHVRLIEAHADGRSIGLLPVVTRRRHGRLPLANVVNWMHPHCFYGAPLLRRGHEEAAWQCLLAELDNAAWAPGFLHLAGIDAAGPVAGALEAVCVSQRRDRQEVARFSRAMLHSPLGANAYLEAHVGAQKRKQIHRKQRGLAELGALSTRQLTDAAALSRWCGEFLALEESGWKGANGTALASTAHDASFFRAAMSGAMASGKLHCLRLDLDGTPIAMLVNFIHGNGSFAFKSAYSEAYRRFSPGFLLEVESLVAVQEGRVASWMDSCTAADNPMIDGLWAERRSIAQFRVALKGAGRRLAFKLANAAEGVVRRVKASHMISKSSSFFCAFLTALFFPEDPEPSHMSRVSLIVRTAYWGTI
jgi:CelD/BcsL family acetyltransferase involved in cellulose biosynthesis